MSSHPWANDLSFCIVNQRSTETKTCKMEKQQGEEGGGVQERKNPAASCKWNLVNLQKKGTEVIEFERLSAYNQTTA